MRKTGQTCAPQQPTWQTQPMNKNRQQQTERVIALNGENVGFRLRLYPTYAGSKNNVQA
jgi:hypothetical protein